MAKASKKAIGFVKPSEEEVFVFINTRMRDWPQRFCQYYANKFWNHYQSNGWKLSSGVAVKDWQAAFWARWNPPSFPGDIKMLETCLKEPVHRIAMDKRMIASAGMFAPTETVGQPSEFDRTVDYLEEILLLFKEKKATDPQLKALYDWFKKAGVMKLPREQINEIMELKGNDNDYAKLLCVKRLFNNLLEDGRTVRLHITQILQHAPNVQTADSSPGQ